MNRRGQVHRWASSLIAAAVLTLALAAETRAAASSAPAEETLEQLNERALTPHRKRCVAEASPLYTELLRRDPPVPPTPEQLERVRALAPRLHLVAGEYFPLKDIVAVVHPDRPVIGYHLFWDDDIAYPADNEPCDHEMVWVEYEPASGRVTHVWTYFHGQVLSSADAVTDANAHGGRPWIGVEWGFHGSVPLGAEAAAQRMLTTHWELAHEKAKTLPQHPLARGWPKTFPGDFAAFTRHAVELDVTPRLGAEGSVYVSRWPTATLNRYCLRYNFAAKPEWPWLIAPKS